jgi:hypothetical protein
MPHTDGFYWVCYEEEWQVAQCFAYSDEKIMWLLTGIEDAVLTNELEAIGERIPGNSELIRMTRLTPSEPKMSDKCADCNRKFSDKNNIGTKLVERYVKSNLCVDCAETLPF